MHKVYTNQLIHETSPYLLQHAHNPVNWFAWGETALKMAKELDKPILISIGYSACHWCHVMEKESFENEATASLMNELFINIKIDREERPDLDHIYMDAVQAISGNGGWPLNVFLTPDLKPFYGGTYFPPEKAFNRASWKDVLTSVSTAWKERKNEMEAQAENLTEHLRKSNRFFAPNVDHSSSGQFNNEFCRTICENLMKNADTSWGGFGKAPKFPQTFSIQFLLRYYYLFNDKTALQQALLSIDKMLQGGIYDQVGGGLARYSTDNEWLAPHFEKMLYDNALLVNVLCDAYQITKEKEYSQAIGITIQFILEELTDPQGGFYAALDADSEGEEGKYYVWSKKEIDELLQADAEIFCAYFDVTDAGNWEHKNILRKLKSASLFCTERGIESVFFEKKMEQCLSVLKAQRKQRIKPLLDDKVILGWNALMLTSVCKAAIALNDESYRSIAISNFIFLRNNFFKKEGKAPMYHTWKNGIAGIPAFLDDYALFIEACLAMYELDFDHQYLETAKDSLSYVIDYFGDEEGVFFYYTHVDQKDVLVRKKEIYDGATPSANAVMAGNLIRLSAFFGISEWKTRAISMMTALMNPVNKYPGSFGIWASLILQQYAGINEIAVIGKDFQEKCAMIKDFYIPFRVIMGAENANENYPLLAGKPPTTNTLFYLCANYSCSAPVENVTELMEAIHLKKNTR